MPLHPRPPTDPAPAGVEAGRRAIRRAGGGRAAELTAREIERFIRENDFEAGARLPSNRVIVDELGESTSSVRAALSVLAATGRVELRRGEGTYVADSPPSHRDIGARLFDALEEHALRVLVEARLGIELAAVTVAVEQATEADFAMLDRLLDGHESALAADASSTWKPLTFELALIEATGNPWLYEVELDVREAWMSLSARRRAGFARHHDWLGEHRAILAALRSRNVAEAQRLVIEHVSFRQFEEARTVALTPA